MPTKDEPRVTFRLAQVDYDALKGRADELGVSMAALCRSGLEVEAEAIRAKVVSAETSRIRETVRVPLETAEAIPDEARAPKPPTRPAHCPDHPDAGSFKDKGNGLTYCDAPLCRFRYR